MRSPPALVPPHTTPRSRPKATIANVVLSIGIVLGLCFSLPGATQDTAIRTLTDFERLYIDGRSTPPDDIKEGWEPMQLKDLWPVDRRKEHLEAWYRTDFELEQVPSERWGIYFARISSSASIWLNTVEIGNTSELFGPTSNAWNHPQLFEMPTEFLKEGSNSLQIRLKVIETEMGMLYEAMIGPYSQLEKIHARATFFKVTASKILTGVMLLGVAIMAIFYFYVHVPTSYLWFMVASLFWAVYSMELFVVDVPMPYGVWDWLVSFSLFAAPACYFAAVARMLNWRSRATEWVLIILAGIHPITALTLSPIAFSLVSFIYLVLSAIIVIAIGVMLLVKGWQRRNANGTWMLVSGAVVTTMILYDVYMYYFEITAVMAPKYYFMPLVATVFGASVSFNRIISVTKENEKFRVNFQTVDSAISSERERLLREIHDGVGGQLVSTLAILEKGDFRSEDIMDSVKTSLDDLRLILNSLEPVANQGDVLGILATIRERLERRLSQAGIQLRWAVNDIPVVENFGSEQALQLMRILQEAITNVVKHAKATEITLTCTEEMRNGKAGISIQVIDNGIGSVEPQSTSGYGIRNMQQRAEMLNGALTVEQDKNGSTVKLWMPIKRSEN